MMMLSRIMTMSYYNIKYVMYSSRKYPYLPQRKFLGEGRGVQKEAISEGWVGFCLGLMVLRGEVP